MARLSLWQKQKNKDYDFIDRISREQFYVGGVSVYVHKYIGPYDQSSSGGSSLVDGTVAASENGQDINETTIQDLLFMENRDRQYDPNVYELRGHFTLSDNDFNLTQIGFLMTADNINVTVHFNDMIDILGRKLMSGDVLEMPNMRDDTLLDQGKDAINKYFKINDADFSAEGYSPTWWRHLWRCTCGPLTDSQEFSDILDQSSATSAAGVADSGSAGTLQSLLSTYGESIAISDSLLQVAHDQVPFRNYQTAQFYFIPGSDVTGSDVIPHYLGMPAILTSSDQPIDGMKALGSGFSFPDDAADGDYFLRTDYEPYVLYKKSTEKKGWMQVQVDYRRTWSAAHRILETFLKNDKEWTDIYQTTVKEKQDLKAVVTPRNIKKHKLPKSDL